MTYELLDAHADTARLAGDEASEAEWQSHLAYLRDLKRVGREALAHAVAINGDRTVAINGDRTVAINGDRTVAVNAGRE